MENVNEFVIQRGVPLPVPVSKYKTKYPFDKMEVGDSFFVDNIKANYLYNISCIWKRSNAPKLRFKALKEGNGARIWRVE